MPSVRAALCLAMLVAAPALAEPAQLGVFGKWTALSATGPDGRVCYVLSKPTASLPKKLARDAAYVMISVWPGLGRKDEVEIAPGYLYREGEPVFAQVGNEHVEFFSRNEGKSGLAWVRNIEDEPPLVSAMRGGSTLTVSGVSKKGTKTTDTYSLSGLGSALDRARRECR